MCGGMYGDFNGCIAVCYFGIVARDHKNVEHDVEKNGEQIRRQKAHNQ